MPTEPKPMPGASAALEPAKALDPALMRGSGPSEHLLVRLKLPLSKRFAAACVQQGRTKAEIVRQLIEGWLKSKKAGA